MQPFKAVIDRRPGGDGEVDAGRPDEDRRGDAHRHVDRRNSSKASRIGSQRPSTRAGIGLTRSWLYQPMLEVMRYLRANGYKTYIVTGGTQPFVRAFAEQSVRHPAGANHRHDGHHEVRSDKDGNDLDAGPEDAAEQQLCRQGGGYLSLYGPPAAMRRSATRPGDQQMLEYTTAGDGLDSACSCCTTTRSANTPTARPTACPTPRSAAFSQALFDEAKTKGWTVISMKKDWKQVFSFEQ